MKPFKKISMLGGLLMLLACVSCVWVETFPHGWRELAANEASDSWRQKNEDKFLKTSGDFNNDGVVDEAKLFIRSDGESIGLFVFCGGQKKPIFLTELKGANFIHAMGVRTVSPGTYQTACGKGYWECQEEEPKITIIQDAIDLFKVESANSFFYWDDNSDMFKRVWISD